MTVRHKDIRFAGTTDEELRVMALEFEAFNETGRIADEALLREKGQSFGPGAMGMTVAALFVFREIAARAEVI